MRVLLLSAYDAVSHRVWREGLVRHLAGFQWTVLTLPPRFFAWRSRGNALSWAFGQRNFLDRSYDLVIATSMTDLAALKGMIPSLSVTPSIVYFHENQFDYPEQRKRKEYQNYKLTNLYTALAADRVLFNSKYNRESFAEGIRGLLSIMPDHVPGGIEEYVLERSEVLPVPLEDACFRTGKPGAGPVQIVWNHRWEHDKAPERFFRALFRLRDRNIPFKLSVLGQRFQDCPDDFEKAADGLQDHLQHWGCIEDEKTYRSHLANSDIVVSTALHDFQGLAVLEAVAAGCLPLVPDRLAYPEFIPGQFRFPSYPEDGKKEAEALAARLEALCIKPEETRRLKGPDLSHLSWGKLGPRYHEIIKEVSGT
ncbi:MAG: DUF3524 domain-containing protein [Pseudomonadota bacterium]|jgi:glycosyltransferase involved in cell wall biosynthesis